MNKLNNITDQIRKGLESYEPDILKIIDNTDALIFGGALVSILAEQKINDIDIFCLNKSREIIKNNLLNLGYSYYHKEYEKSSTDYIGISIISQPQTFIKENKTIQLISPRIYEHIQPDGSDSEFEYWINHNKRSKVKYSDKLEKVLIDIISNVDISICSLFYNGKDVFETIEGAYTDILNKTFRWFPENTMSTDRLHDRINKYKKRGFTNNEFSNQNEKLNFNKINLSNLI